MVKILIKLINFNNKFILQIFTIFFILISYSKANDIKDFQIGEMSVKESLLNYFDKNLIIKELESEFTFFYKNKTYAVITAGNTSQFDLRINSNIYEDIGITIKPGDKNYIIYGLSGRIFCEKDINYCKSKKKEINDDLKDFFGKNIEIKNADQNHAYDKTGRSKSFNTYYTFKSGDYITVATYDWHPEVKNKNGLSFPDNTRVVITTKELDKFLSKVQYN